MSAHQDFQSFSFFLADFQFQWPWPFFHPTLPQVYFGLNVLVQVQETCCVSGSRSSQSK